MRWSKIKNIIILLLVVVNGFLLAQVGLREWRSHRNERETRQRVVDILERNGVSYLPAEVPGALELQGRRLTLSLPGETEAALLVGQISSIQTQGVRTTYEGPRGTVSISPSGEVEAIFFPGAYPKEADLSAQGLEFLSSLGVQARQFRWEDKGAYTYLTYVQLWDGVPIPEWTAVLISGEKDLERFTLRCLVGTEELLPAAEETITAATALTRLLDELSRGEGYVCSQITDMYPGYLQNGTNSVTLTPAWFIETDTWRFIVDGQTGTVTATE